MKTKVLIITVSAFPFNTSSANLLRTLSKGFIKNGIEVDILIQRGQVVKNNCDKNSKSCNFEGITYRYCKYVNRPKSKIKLFFDILWGIVKPPLYIYKNRKKIDFILTYNNYFHEDIFNVVICKILKKRIIHYDDDWFNKNSVVHTIFDIPKWHSYLLKKYFLSKRYDGIGVISHYLYDFYLKIGIDKRKLIIVPHFLDIPSFENPNCTRNDTKIVIGYIGAALIENGVDDLIVSFVNLVKKYSNLKLLIVGDKVGNKSEIPPLKKMAEKYLVDNYVEFTGRVDGTKIPNLLSSCDILVLPRKKSLFSQAGFPTKLGEYFATKKPVVLTRVGDMGKYFVDREQVVYAEPNNPDSLSESISYLIFNSNMRMKIGLAGYEWALNNLDYINNSKKIIDFFYLKKELEINF